MINEGWKIVRDRRRSFFGVAAVAAVALVVLINSVSVF